MHLKLAFFSNCFNSFVPGGLFIHVLYTVSKTSASGIVEFSRQQGLITLHYADKEESHNTNST